MAIKMADNHKNHFVCSHGAEKVVVTQLESVGA
jgi:hypothetical protein